MEWQGKTHASLHEPAILTIFGCSCARCIECSHIDGSVDKVVAKLMTRLMKSKGVLVNDDQSLTAELWRAEETSIPLGNKLLASVHGFFEWFFHTHERSRC
jgi:hypothetical protein